MGYFESREDRWNIVSKILRRLIGIILRYIRHIVRAAAMDGLKEMAEVTKDRKINRLLKQAQNEEVDSILKVSSQ